MTPIQPYMDQVGWTAPDALAQLSDMDFLKENRPEEFRRRDLGQGGSSATIQSEGWVEAKGRLSIKFARIQSHTADIATLMIYPVGSPDLLPVFASEWVVVQGRCHALILDVQAAGAQPDLLHKLNQVIGQTFLPFREAFQDHGERPDWFQEIATPWTLCGSAPLDALPQIREAYNVYLQSAVSGFYLPLLPRAIGGLDHQAVRGYKEHHRLHFPGRPMLVTKAGEAWTETFLSKWHFGPPGPVS